MSASYSDDCTHGNVTVLTANEGFLAMFARPVHTTTGSRNTSPGTEPVDTTSCPWMLISETGRRFNVSWRLPSSNPLPLLGGPTLLHHDIDQPVSTGWRPENICNTAILRFRFHCRLSCFSVNTDNDGYPFQRFQLGLDGDRYCINEHLLHRRLA